MKLTETEIRFMNIIWDNNEIKSGELVKKCSETFGWKKSTTYTFLKRLQDKQVLVSENSIIRPLVTKNSVQKQESLDIINNTFNGSLPNFVTAFLSEQKISKKDYEELRNILDSYKGK